MRVRLTEEQLLLRDSARKFLAGLPHPHAADATVWEQICGLGWPAILVPEVHGGLDFGLLSMSLLVEEMGRVGLPGWFFPTAVTGAICLTELASEAAQAELLPALAGGGTTLALAIQEGASEFDFSAMSLRADPLGEGYVLRGEKLLVDGGDSVEQLLLIAPIPGSEEHCDLFLVPRQARGVRCVPLQTMNGYSQCNIRFEAVRVASRSRLNSTPLDNRSLARVLAIASVVKSAELVGVAQMAMELAVDYARERRQFGAAIGSFQAVQHHCVNMLVQVESARRITYRAAAAVDAGNFTPGRIVRAKAWTNQASREVIRLAHQVLGGVGYCEDHPMPRCFRQTRQAEAALGDSDTLLDLVAGDLLEGEFVR